MTNRLADKVAFITGAARGQAISKVAEADGNHVLMNMLTPFLPNWVAEPEDIADTVCWLASDESKLITAQEISVDQGSTRY